jgi:hypothetical protein
MPLAVANVAAKGRGVFTTSKISKGEPIATDCVVLVPKDHFEQVGPPLACYPLAWDKECHCLVLGLISLVNHAEEPNSYPERDMKKLLLRLVAKRDIEAGEEITYHYKVPLWFEPEPPAKLNLEGIK